jgi:hypothetical protein
MAFVTSPKDRRRWVKTKSNGQAYILVYTRRGPRARQVSQKGWDWVRSRYPIERYPSPEDIPMSYEDYQILRGRGDIYVGDAPKSQNRSWVESEEAYRMREKALATLSNERTSRRKDSPIPISEQSGAPSRPTCGRCAADLALTARFCSRCGASNPTCAKDSDLSATIKTPPAPKADGRSVLIGALTVVVALLVWHAWMH